MGILNFDTFKTKPKLKLADKDPIYYDPKEFRNGKNSHKQRIPAYEEKKR